MGGVNKLNYDGSYWPNSVQGVEDASTVQWLQQVLWLVPLPSRPAEYDPLLVQQITTEGVQLLSDASNQAWQAIQDRDAPKLGDALSKTMQAWAVILPHTV